MRIIFVVIAVAVLLILINLQLKLTASVFQNTPAGSYEGVNQQVQDMQQKVDKYNQDIENLQNKTKDALKEIN